MKINQEVGGGCGDEYYFYIGWLGKTSLVRCHLNREYQAEARASTKNVPLKEKVVHPGKYYNEVDREP
jgi:hypothetical protein